VCRGGGGRGAQVMRQCCHWQHLWWVGCAADHCMTVWKQCCCVSHMGNNNHKLQLAVGATAVTASSSADKLPWSCLA
jgi:hypothetical protein